MTTQRGQCVLCLQLVHSENNNLLMSSYNSIFSCRMWRTSVLCLDVDKLRMTASPQWPRTHFITWINILRGFLCVCCMHIGTQITQIKWASDFDWLSSCVDTHTWRSSLPENVSHFTYLFEKTEAVYKIVVLPTLPYFTKWFYSQHFLILQSDCTPNTSLCYKMVVYPTLPNLKSWCTLNTFLRRWNMDTIEAVMVLEQHYDAVYDRYCLCRQDRSSNT